MRKAPVSSCITLGGLCGVVSLAMAGRRPYTALGIAAIGYYCIINGIKNAGRNTRAQIEAEAK